MEWITALSVSLLILSSTSSSLLFELLSTGLFSIVTVFVSSVTFVWYFFVYSLLKFPVHAFFSWDGDYFYDPTLNSSSCQSLFSVSLRSVCGVLFLFKTYFSVSSLSLTPCVVVFPLDPSSWGYANICQCPSGGELSQHQKQADWRLDPQAAASKVCENTSFRERLRDGHFCLFPLWWILRG